MGDEDINGTNMFAASAQPFSRGVRYDQRKACEETEINEVSIPWWCPKTFRRRQK
jgi:hypothetical protein